MPEKQERFLGPEKNQPSLTGIYKGLGIEPEEIKCIIHYDDTNKNLPARILALEKRMDNVWIALEHVTSILEKLIRK